MEKVRAHIIVSGKVQGVGYRNNTFKQAKKIGVNGWIRNLEDGRVEAVFEGEKQEVEKIVNWAKRGPLSTNISDFKIEWQEPKEEFKNFEIK